MTTRREFLKQGGLAAAAIAATACAGSAPGTLPAPQPTGAMTPAPAADASERALVLEAIGAARAAGASYADARVGRYRSASVATRERQIVQVTDSDSAGCGVRALVDGTWGFAATRALTSDGVARAAREAVAIAKANRVARDRAVVLAPTESYADGVWKGAYVVDPFTIPVEQQAELLLRANAAALAVPGVRFVNSTLFFVKEDRTFASTEGTVTRQSNVRTWLPMAITAVAPDFSDFQTRANTVAPMARGWEYILEQDIVGNAPRWAEEAVRKLSAKPVDVGRYDLVLDPAHLWLTIHEAIGHPTELDRAMGYEANYAGTSFVAPPEKMLGALRYGPEFLNVQGDRNQPGALATIGWDDEGVRPEPFLIVKDGLLHDYQTTREQAPWLEWWYAKQGRAVRSHGCSNADSWSSVQFQRMPNVSILPGEKEQSLEDLVAATDRGILIEGDGSFSIDQQRFNAQFGGQVFHEIRGGKITGMLKDVAYQIRTPDFWNSLDMIGGKASYRLGGSFFDGKGQPGQVNAVSHGCPPCRFRQVNVINTGRKA
jgi:TldD protein